MFFYHRKLEKDFLKKYHAAVKIQKVFRGWLVRTNLAMLTNSVVKIQSLWRRALARIRYQKLDQVSILGFSFPKKMQ